MIELNKNGHTEENICHAGTQGCDGGGVCYKVAIPTARVLAKKYHVILNAYDGFNPSEPETEYKSAMDEARRMGDYVVENYGGKIDILYGVSYGCRVVNEVYRQDHGKKP